MAPVAGKVYDAGSASLFKVLAKVDRLLLAVFEMDHAAVHIKGATCDGYFQFLKGAAAVADVDRIMVDQVIDGFGTELTPGSGGSKGHCGYRYGDEGQG